MTELVMTQHVAATGTGVGGLDHGRGARPVVVAPLAGHCIRDRSPTRWAVAGAQR